MGGDQNIFEDRASTPPRLQEMRACLRGARQRQVTGWLLQQVAMER
jgi:hypothetical protein